MIVSPVEKIGSQTFIKFDRIKFELYNKKVSFKLGENEMFYLDLEEEGYSAGDTLTIIGIEGRMKMDINL